MERTFEDCVRRESWRSGPQGEGSIHFTIKSQPGHFSDTEMVGFAAAELDRMTPYVLRKRLCEAGWFYTG